MSFAALQTRVNTSALTRLGNKGASGIVLLNAVAVNADFCKPYAQGMANGMGAEMSAPQIALPTAQVGANVRGKTVLADGGTYKVVEHQRDGYGMSTLLLEAA